VSGASITRRRALAWLAALGALPLVRCGTGTDPEHVVMLRRDRRSAELLGHTWLEAQRPAPGVDELLLRICGESGCEALQDDPERMRRHITQRHVRDLERGQLESVDGWLLSRTEVALCALVALVALGD